jgi:hypothetical protein
MFVARAWPGPVRYLDTFQIITRRRSNLQPEPSHELADECPPQAQGGTELLVDSHFTIATHRLTRSPVVPTEGIYVHRR